MVIKRDKYLQQLVEHMNTNMIKIIAGIRRCGKSFLLFNLFYEHLKSIGLQDNQIIMMNLDQKENEYLRNADALYDYIKSRITSEKKQYYVLLDELQYTITKEDLKNKDKPLPIYDLLNSLMHLKK